MLTAAGLVDHLVGRLAARRSSSPRTEPVADAPESPAIRALVIQKSSGYRRTLAETVGRVADPRIRLEFTSGLGDVAAKLSAGVFDVVVLDVERCLPAQLFWRLNSEHWRLPVVVLQSGLSAPCPGRLARDSHDGELVRRALLAAIRRAGARSLDSVPASEREVSTVSEGVRRRRAVHRRAESVRHRVRGALRRSLSYANSALTLIRQTALGRFPSLRPLIENL